MHLRQAMLAVLVLLCAATASSQPRDQELTPVDEAPTKPEFFTFRARLQAAVARHDVEAIVSMSNPGIRESFGDGGGAASWRRALATPGTPLFGQLAETLALGGSFPSPDQFVAPYVYSRWPEGLDAFLYVAIVGERVQVRAAPSPTARVIATLSYALVQVGDAGEQNGMAAIRLASGAEGFVATRFLRSSVGHRALFDRRDGRWQLMAFVAGD